MTSARTALQDFATANPIYANAIVTVHTVEDGGKTPLKADLYTGISGVGKAANPQILDSFGKFKQPVYIDRAVILTVTGLKNTPDHDTGIISVERVISGSGAPEGVVTAAPGTLYLNTDGGAGATLFVKETGTSSTGWSAK